MKQRGKRGRRLVLPAASGFFALLVSAMVLPMALEGCGNTQVEVVPEVTTLEVWYYWDIPTARQCIASLVNDFNRSHANLEVVLKYVPDEDFKKTLALAVADDVMPDLAIVDSVDVQYYNSMGTLRDVTEYVDADEYLDLALESCKTKEGNYLGLPLSLNCLSFYYNTDILKRAHVVPPTTLDEFVEAARQVSSDSVYGCAFPSLQSEESIYCFLPVLWAKGGSLDNITSEESAAAFEFVRQLAMDGSMSASSVNMTLTDITREFAKERLAMVFAVSGSEKLIRELNPDIQFEVAGIPNGMPSVSVVGGEVLTVTSKDHVEEAEEFLKFMAEPEQVSRYANGVGYLAPRKDILKLQVEQDPFKQKYIHCLQHARTRDFKSYWPAMSLLVADTINQVILQEDPPNVLEQLAKEISRVQEDQDEEE